MKNYPVSFAKVDTSNVFGFLEGAKKRIIWAKPAFTKLEISYLLELKNEKGLSIEVFLEKGEKAYRNAFGEVASIKLLQENEKKIDIQLVERIRLAIAVVDDQAIVYAPNLSFMEKESDTSSFPNGIFCDELITNDLLKQFYGHGSGQEDAASGIENRTDSNIDVDDEVNLSLHKPQDVLSTNLIFFPGCEEIFEASKALNIKDELNKMSESLESDPPVNPDNLQKINLYRNKYKLFKMTVYGVRINSKTINIKPIYRLLSKADERLKSSWTVFSKDDIKNLEDMKLFDQELEKVKNENKVMDVGRFGFIIYKSNKKKFQEEILKLVAEFKSFLRNANTGENNNRFSKLVEDQNQKSIKSDAQDTSSVVSLKSVLDDSRSELEKHLIAQWPKGDKELFEEMFNKHRYIANKNSNGEYSDQLFYEEASKTQIIKALIEYLVIEKLKFTQADEIIDRIDVKLDIVDISDELLFENEDFKKYLEEYQLDMRDYSEGYEEIQTSR